MDLLDLRKADGHLYVTEIGDSRIVWRPLPWKRWKSYRDMAWQNPEIVPELEERMVRECVVDGTEFDLETVVAGTISTLAVQMIAASGSSDPEEALSALDLARNQILQMDEQMTLLVCKAFGCTPEEAELLPWPEFLRRVAMAEQITGAKLQRTESEAKARQTDTIDIEKEARELERAQGTTSPEEPARQSRADLRAAYLRQRGM